MAHEISDDFSNVIAVDGPAASGKGTLARRLAAHFGYAHLDTGKLYRAVGLVLLDAGTDPMRTLASGRRDGRAANARPRTRPQVRAPESRSHRTDDGRAAGCSSPAQ